MSNNPGVTKRKRTIIIAESETKSKWWGIAVVSFFIIVLLSACAVSNGWLPNTLTSEKSTQPPTQTPVKISSKPTIPKTAETSTQSPTQTEKDVSTQLPTQKMAETSTQPPAQTVTEEPTRPPTQMTTQVQIQNLTEMSSQAPTESSVSFISVSGITGIPNTATAGTSLYLTGTINPSNATNKTITWNLVNAGGTGASINENILNTVDAGTIIARATVINGTAIGTNYTQDFNIDVTVPHISVTSILDVPNTATAGTSLYLMGTINPTNATNKTIAWSVVNDGGTGASINGNTFNATNGGNGIVRATVINGIAIGINYTQDFNIYVIEPHISVMSITGVPSTAIAGTSLELTGIVNPSNSTNKFISWSIVNDGWTGAIINGNLLTLDAYYVGTLIVRATILNDRANGNDYFQDFYITVTLPEWEYIATGNNTVTITRYNGIGGHVVIPSTIDGNTVTVIGKPGIPHAGGGTQIFPIFDTQILVTSITIPNSITRIEDSAFDNLDYITDITIPNSITYIGSNAFHDCGGLTNITIPSSVTYIGDSAFVQCTSLTSVTIQSNSIYIGEFAFHTRISGELVYGDSVTIFVLRNSSAYDYCVRNGYRFEFIN